jgi:hypothetical protein
MRRRPPRTPAEIISDSHASLRSATVTPLSACSRPTWRGLSPAAWRRVLGFSIEIGANHLAGVVNGERVRIERPRGIDGHESTPRDFQIETCSGLTTRPEEPRPESMPRSSIPISYAPLGSKRRRLPPVAIARAGGRNYLVLSIGYVAWRSSGHGGIIAETGS